MNRVDRLLAMVLLLQSRRVVRAKDIADHFAISIRTVYRDMRALGEAGVPVAAEAGEGYSLVEGYHLPPVMFTREEASALVLGGTFVEKLTDASMVKNAHSALLKIQSLLPETTQEYLEKLSRSMVLLSWRSQPAGAGSEDMLVSLQEAIVQSRVLRLDYYALSRDASSRRDVEPLGLLHYAGHWHLIAYCRLRQDYRDFRIDRIRRLRESDSTFTPRPGFSLKHYLQNFDRFENPIEVKLKFNRRVAETVRDRHRYGLVEEIEQEDDVVMTYLTDDLRWMVHWVLSYGTYVQVLAPPVLRQALRELAGELMYHHREP